MREPRRLTLDEIIDPAGARVIVDRAPDGSVRGARFDLTGLPRVDPMLVGRSALEVPTLVERLCGVCPAAHHLAGTRALESLLGVRELTPAADRSRRLLHHASAVATHAIRAMSSDPDATMALRRLAKAVSTAVGSPGHFPVTAIPGGVSTAVTDAARDDALALLPDALAAAERIARRLLAESDRTGEDFAGADVALVDVAGRPDLLGDRLRAVADDGATIVDGASVDVWDELVTESVPGAMAPRPYLTALGAERGGYRVGPVAQLRVGELTTPDAAGLQEQWLHRGTGAAAARAVITLHSVEAIGEQLNREVGDALAVPVPAVAAGVGVGWVDGPRGLLVHRYTVADDGLVGAAQILTPTAQNEPWLGQLLAASLGDESSMEDAIREADPCLPVSSAPAGTMGLSVVEGN